MNEKGEFGIYRIDNDQIQVVDHMPFDLMTTVGVAEIRRQIKELSGKLSSCDVIVAKKIIGLFYTILDPQGFDLWEIEGNVESFIHELIEDLKEEDNLLTSKQDEISIEPQKINDQGSYYINLKKLNKELQGTKSSKQILLPFIENQTFYELKVACSHVPPWFDKKLSDYNLSYTVDTFIVGTEHNEIKEDAPIKAHPTDGEIIITIRQKVCS